MDTEAIEDWVFEKYYSRYPHPYSHLMGMLAQSCGYCGGKRCLRACYAHLEKIGKIDSSFHQPFRFPGEPPRDIPPKKSVEGVIYGKE